jgi:hypothetical protein
MFFSGGMRQQETDGRKSNEGGTREGMRKGGQGKEPEEGHTGKQPWWNMQGGETTRKEGGREGR